MSRISYNSDGTIRSRRAPHIEQVRLSEEDAKDPASVAAAVLKLSNQLQKIGNMVPAEIRDYEYAITTGTSTTLFIPHGLGNSVRYWVAEWTSADAPPAIRRVAASSDSNTLALSVDTSTLTASAVLVIRVEPA